MASVLSLTGDCAWCGGSSANFFNRVGKGEIMIVVVIAVATVAVVVVAIGIG